MDFYQIGALKVFADIGTLIEEDERNQVTILDLPTDIIQNNILNHLKKIKLLKKNIKKCHKLNIYY